MTAPSASQALPVLQDVVSLEQPFHFRLAARQKNYGDTLLNPHSFGLGPAASRGVSENRVIVCLAERSARGISSQGCAARTASGGDPCGFVLEFKFPSRIIASKQSMTDRRRARRAPSDAGAREKGKYACVSVKPEASRSRLSVTSYTTITSCSVVGFAVHSGGPITGGGAFSVGILRRMLN